MKRFSLSAGALATVAVAAALLVGAPLGIASGLPYGQLSWLGCIGASPCTTGTVAPMDEPGGLVLTGEQDRVLVTSHASNSLDILKRDTKTGKLSQLPGTFGCVSETGDGGQCFDGHALVGPVDVTNSENYVYVVSDGSNAVAIIYKDRDKKDWRQSSGTDGCVSEDGSGGCTDGYALAGASSVELNSNASKLWVGGANTIAWFERNKSTGALRETGCVSPTGTEGAGCTPAYVPGTVTDLVASADGKNLYALASGTVLEFKVFRGLLTEIGCLNDDGSNGCTDSTAPFVNPEGLALNEGGKSMYVAANGSDTLAMFARDAKNKATPGLLSPVAGPTGCYNPGGTGGCTAALGMADPHRVRVCENSGCVLVSAGDGVASFFRSFKNGALSQPAAPFVPCFNSTGSGGCTQADGLGGAMGIDSVGGGVKQMYVAGSTDDSVSEFHLR